MSPCAWRSGACSPDIIAPYNVPAHDNSAMDGYAVRAQVIWGRSARRRSASSAPRLRAALFSGIVGPGQAVRIMTGASIPQGADTIVVQEIARREHDRVFIPAGQKK